MPHRHALRQQASTRSSPSPSAAHDAKARPDSHPKGLFNMPSSSVKTALKGIPFVSRLATWLNLKRAQALSRFRWGSLARQGRIQLELGSGPKRGTNGWTTVDLFGADINWDLKKGIPLGDDSVDRIYTSHMFEHIPYKHLVGFVGECKRVLKDGGSLSVCVPNAGFYIRAYIEGKNFRESSSYFQPAVVHTGSFMDQVNYIAYMDGGHAYMFDQENLVNTLKKGGFTKVSLRDFDPALDLQGRDFESIYALAQK
jgi:predicted SAM-dependent methyltransferase